MASTHRAFVVLAFCLSVAALSMYQTFVYSTRVPDGFRYPLVHNYESDYYWYLSLMRQGYDGSIAVTSRFTPESFPPRLVNTFFPVAGMVAGMAGLSLPGMYTLLRVVCGGALLFMAYLALSSVFARNRYRFMTFALVLFGSPLWYLENGVLKQAGEFWTGFDPVFRISWLPHHTLSNALMIGALIFTAPGLSGSRKGGSGSYWRYPVAGILSFMSVWLNPASILTLAASLVVAAAFQIRLKGRIKALFSDMLVVIVCIALPAGILWNLQNDTFPWTAFRDWERNVHYPVTAVSYIAVTGITGILAVISLPSAFSGGNPLTAMTAAWFALPLLALMVPQSWLPLSNGRFLQSAPHIPAAILTGMLLARWSQSKSRLFRRVYPVFVAAIIIFQAPAFWASIARQLNYVTANRSNPLVYISDYTWNAFEAFGGKRGVIIAPPHVMPLVPAFTSLRTVAGHPTFTYDVPGKLRDSGIFWRGETGEMARIIQSYGITLVWTPPGWTGESALQGLGFVKRYENSGAVIYEKQ